MSKRLGRLRRARLLWSLGLGFLLSGGVLIHALAAPPVRPVADAREDFNAVTGAPTTLDGSDTFDPDTRLLTFHWRLLDAPIGSAATLADPADRIPPSRPMSQGSITSNW